MPSGVKTQSLCVIKSLICRLLKWMSPNTNCTGWPVPAAARPRARPLPAGVLFTNHSSPRLQATAAAADRWLPPQQTPSANHAGGLLRRSHVDGRSLRPWATQTSQILAPVVEELQEFCRTQPANIDETGWRPKNAGTLAVGGGDPVGWSPSSHCSVARRQGRCAVAGRRLPSRPEAVIAGARITVNRCGAHRQVCWAHLQRDFPSNGRPQQRGVGHR